MSKIISLFLIGLMLSACGAAPAETLTPEPTPESLGTPTNVSSDTCSAPSDWTVEFHRTGGIAGLSETLTLNSEGSLTVQSKRPPIDVKKSISDQQVKAVADLLSQACPFEMGTTKDNCADCFTYELDIQMDDRSYSVQASDVTLTDELHPLIEKFSQIIQDTGQ